MEKKNECPFKVAKTWIPTSLLDSIKSGIEKLNYGGYLDIKYPTFARQALIFYSNMCISKNLGEELNEFLDCNGKKPKKTAKKKHLDLSSLGGSKNFDFPDFSISAELREKMDKAIRSLELMGYKNVTTTNFLRQAMKIYSNLCITKQVGFGFRDIERSPDRIVLGTDAREENEGKAKYIEEDFDEE